MDTRNKEIQKAQRFDFLFSKSRKHQNFDRICVVTMVEPYRLIKELSTVYLVSDVK